MAFWTEKNGSIIIFITVIPKSSKNEISGLRKDILGQQRLIIRLKAVPEKGKANKALIAFMAKKMHIAKSSLILISGETSRQKNIKLNLSVNEAKKQLQYLYP